MLSLYEILKASKTGLAPDMWTSLAGMNWSGADSGHEVKELTGIPPLSFTADGTPLLDYLISGNMSQSGTPTPTNPIQPQECGERTGNLWDLQETSTPTTINDVTWSITNGTIRGNGTTTSIAAGDAVVVYDGFHRNANYINYCSIKPEWAIKLPAGTYTFSATVIKRGEYAILVLVGKSGANIQKGTAQSVKPGESFTTDGEDYVMLVVATDTAHSEYEYSNIMLNSGSTALSYEPWGIKIPISSTNTTTPVYLGEVETTRKIYKLVLTGQETGWYAHATQSNLYVLAVTDYLFVSNVSSICSHYTTQVTASASSVPDKKLAFYYNAGSPTTRLMYIKDTSFADLTSFKQYLADQYSAGTPVTVWYVLATPTTGIVNEPLRKIGDYADTLSYEQAGVSVPTLHGNTVIDVETTLKPSEMYIKYQE